MKLPIYIIDAFTNKAFAGNPAAVCLLSGQKLSDEVLQKIAAEMNLSETAFITLPTDGQTSYEQGSRFGLRWFTPVNEVKLCGHATLASAATIFYIIGNQSGEIKFDTLSGTLSAVKAEDRISIFLPECKPVHVDETEVQELLDVMFTGSLKPIDTQRSPALDYLVFRLPDSCTRSELENLRFDFGKFLTAKCTCPVDSVTITVKGSTDNGSVDDNGVPYDFISRFFTPWFGIPEDPVTGSAHAVLAPYWAEKLHKEEFYARQCSSRGGELSVNLVGDGKVKLTGAAKVILQGSINVD